MADGISITDAIAALRRLHDASYDLAPLVTVAMEHDLDLATTGGDEISTAHRYREKLSTEYGAPTLDDFRASWPTTPTDNAKRVAYAWSQLGPRDRVEAVADAADYIKDRQALRLRPQSGATYITGRSWQFVASRRKLGL